MTLREQTENTELSVLSEYACKSTDKKMTNRTRTEEKCPYRTDFQRDRDRILHPRATTTEHVLPIHLRSRRLQGLFPVVCV